MTCSAARLSASPRRTGSIKQREKERDSSYGRAILFFFYQSPSKPFYFAVGRIIFASQQRWGSIRDCRLGCCRIVREIAARAPGGSPESRRGHSKLRAENPELVHHVGRKGRL